MFTHNPKSPTKLILDHMLRGDVVPLYVDEIISEYQDVPSREQFFFKPENVASVINAIERFGINPGRKDAEGKEFPDPKDPIVVTPAEFLDILKNL